MNDAEWMENCMDDADYIPGYDDGEWMEPDDEIWMDDGDNDWPEDFQGEEDFG